MSGTDVAGLVVVAGNLISPGRGMVSVCPTSMWLALLMPFINFNSRMVMPNRLAILPSVSPF